MKPLIRIYTSLLVLLTCLVACGPEEEGPIEPERFPPLEDAEPLNLGATDLGVGVHHGGPLSAAHFAPDAYEKIIDTTPHAVLYLQSFDEAARVFGEYHVSPAPTGVDARGAEQFIGTNSSRARLEARATDLFGELDASATQAGVDGFDSHSIVLDFWRIRRDWFVRWDGNFGEDRNTIGKGPYGFYRSDMVTDLLDQIETVAAEHQPRYFIVGDEIERLFAAQGGSGLAPAEFSNFMIFYAEAATRIKEASPDTEVGAGIHWDRFVEAVAPQFDTGNMSNDEILARAFEAFVLPFAEIGDVVALESHRPADEGEYDYPDGPLSVEASYQFLRRINDLWETDVPLVFYSIGSPVESPVAYLKQRNYLEDFVTWTAGLEPGLVAWRAMLNFEGTDTSDQAIDGRCLAFTTNDQFEMPKHRCYDGLYSSVFSPKNPFTFLVEQTE